MLSREGSGGSRSKHRFIQVERTCTPRMVACLFAEPRASAWVYGSSPSSERKTQAIMALNQDVLSQERRRMSPDPSCFGTTNSRGQSAVAERRLSEAEGNHDFKRDVAMVPLRGQQRRRLFSCRLECALRRSARRWLPTQAARPLRPKARPRARRLPMGPAPNPPSQQSTAA